MEPKAQPNKSGKPKQQHRQQHKQQRSSGNHGRNRPLNAGQRRGASGRGRKSMHPKSGKGGRSGHTKKMTILNKPPESLGNYKITKEIGKGAFGRVYKCIDKRNLRVFAIKTITTRNMNAQQKKDVQSEVELLASLPPHENIVRYVGTVEESQYFCIVLEYVDLGSLQSFIRQFGTEVTEQNVASFIIQILSGLNFLHEQGIIHRDIKAANVLITNDGVAKLADFGVAIKSKGGDGDNANIIEEVAGSPYWMAPEIIEMRGQLTPACDIWAVGATAIELFTGHPPYHNLQAMSALFRIVQDPHPEIPAKASNLFKEFLYQTFCKDPSRRPSASDLQGHKWLINMMHDNDAVYGDIDPNNKQIKTPAANNKVVNNNAAAAATSAKRDDGDTDSEDEAGTMDPQQSEILQSTVKLGKKKLAEELAKRKEEEAQRKKMKISEDKEEDDAMSTKHLTGTFKKDAASHTLTTPNGDVIMVHTSIPRIEGAKSAKKKKVAALKKVKTPKPTKEKKEKKSKKSHKKEKDESESSGWSDSGDDNESGESGSDSSSDSSGSSSSGSDSSGSDSDSDESESSGDFGDVVVNPLDFDKRFDDHDVDSNESEVASESDWVDDEDDEAGLGLGDGNQNQLDAIHQILKRLDENITNLQHFDDHPINLNIANKTGTNIIDAKQEQEMVDELEKLNKIFEQSSQLIGQCIKTAIIPIMEMLSIPSEDVRCTALKTINIIISDPKEGAQHLQTLCLVQLIPAIGNMVRVRSIRIKNAAAPFLTKFCEDKKGEKNKKTKNFVRQMFIACGGIGILVDCLRNKYCNDNKKIIFVAVDCIHAIFESKMHNRRDLGRLFTKAKLLKRLLKRLHDSFGDVDDIKKAIQYGEKMAEIFFRIAELTDRVVKTNISGTSSIAQQMGHSPLSNLSHLQHMQQHQQQQHQYHGGMNNLSGDNIFHAAMGIPNILPNRGAQQGLNNGIASLQQPHAQYAHTVAVAKRKDSSILAQLLGLLPALEDDAKMGGKRKLILLRILKSFAELSKDSLCIGPLIEAKTMSTVVPFLKSPDQDIQTCVVMILWNMTRVNGKNSTHARKEAAKNGAIPVLKRLIQNKSHKSMYFLVQTICKFPNDADKETLFEMKKHNMCQFYIDMTKSGHGLSLDALSALARWIENDEYIPRLEFVLCQPDNITQLIQLFKNPINKRGKSNKPSGKSKNVSSILDAFKTLIFKSKRIADKLGDSNVFLQALGEWFQNDHLPPEIVKDLLQMLIKLFEYLEPSSKKKCAKSILPIMDVVFQMGQRKKKAIVVHLISKELIPKISLHVDQADIDDLCPELRKILDPLHH